MNDVTKKKKGEEIIKSEYLAASVNFAFYPKHAIFKFQIVGENTEYHIKNMICFNTIYYSNYFKFSNIIVKLTLLECL